VGGWSQDSTNDVECLDFTRSVLAFSCGAWAVQTLFSASSTTHISRSCLGTREAMDQLRLETEEKSRKVIENIILYLASWSTVRGVGVEGFGSKRKGKSIAKAGVMVPMHFRGTQVLLISRSCSRGVGTKPTQSNLIKPLMGFYSCFKPLFLGQF
jgi:hypothetical protein